MTSTLELLKQNKCYCLKKQKVIKLSQCDIINCHREKGCTKSTNNKVEKEIQNAREKEKISR